MISLSSWRADYRNWPVQAKHIALGSLAVMLLLISGCYFLVNQTRKEGMTAAVNATEAVAVLAREYVDSTLDSADNYLRYAKRHLEATGEFPRHLRPFRTNDTIMGVYWLDANGQLLSDTLNKNRENADVYSDHFKFHADNDSPHAYLGNTVWDRTMSKWIIPLSRRVNYPDGTFRGVLISLIQAAAVRHHFDQIAVPAGTKLYAVGRDGLIRAVASNTNLQLGSASEIDPSLPNLRDHSKMSFPVDIGDAQMVSSYSAVSGYPLAVRVLIPRASLLTPADVHVGNYLVLAAFLVIVLLLLTFVSIKSVLTRRGSEAAMVRAQKELKAMVTAKNDDLRASNEKLRRLAYFDSMTNLPNRVYMTNWLEQALLKSRKDGSGGLVIAINLDDVRTVNDVFGHASGDLVIFEAVRRLRSLQPEKSFLAHFGGDEFVLACPDLTDRVHAQNLLNDILTELRHEQQFNDIAVSVSASMGAAFYPDDGITPAAILQRADNAMLYSKTQGKDRWKFFTNEMQIRLYDDVSLTHELRSALANDEFRLAYQPQVEVATGRLTGFEALIRWPNPVRGFVPPGKFIPLAEQNGLIHGIGKWVMAESCRFVKRLEQLGYPDVHVSINVSAQQFARADFLQSVESIISASEVRLNQIELEITETAIINSLEGAIKKLDVLRNQGLMVAIDDFGTGYSSLNYLLQLPFDNLKIDKSFIDNIPGDTKGTELVRVIVLLSHTLGKHCIAEGVEDETQQQTLWEMGCDTIQGYHYSKPLPGERAIAFLEKNRAELAKAKAEQLGDSELADPQSV